jgi:isoquinoline 1-oxidoreductase beta subunit
LAVLNLAAEKAQWKSALPQGIYHGVAVGERNGTYVAHVIEVSAEKMKFRIQRVVCAIDCGLAVNPDGVVAPLRRFRHDISSSAALEAALERSPRS